MTAAFMRLAVVLALAAIVAQPRSASAQEPPPRLPVVVVDLHAVVPHFPGDPRLAASRGISQAQLPAFGIGGTVGAHVHLFKWRAVTFGIGGEMILARGHRTPPVSAMQTAVLAPVTERFRSLAPQVSFNFGTGDGWSYLSGGVGISTWSVVPEGAAEIPGDNEALKTVNYGGGARWFMKPHLAFSFDVRFYAVNPGPPNGPIQGSPRTTMVVVGAGVSVK